MTEVWGLGTGDWRPDLALAQSIRVREATGKPTVRPVGRHLPSLIAPNSQYLKGMAAAMTGYLLCTL